MGDEDFFKDYPPVAPDGADSSNAAINLGPPPGAAGDGSNPFGAGDDANPFGAGDDAEPLAAEHASPGARSASSGGAGAASASASEEEEKEEVVEECAAVVAWREQFARRLEEKAAAEREGKAERTAAARETIMKMHSAWEKRCEGTREANAEREKEILRERDGVLARMSKPGEPPNWSIVPELCDVSGKFKEGQRDTSRMRQVLLKLKTT